MQYKIIKGKQEKFFIYDTWQNLYFNHWEYWERKVIDEIDPYSVDYEEFKGANYVREPDFDSNFTLEKAQQTIEELIKYGGKYQDESLNYHNYILVPCCEVKFKQLDNKIFNN